MALIKALRAVGRLMEALARRRSAATVALVLVFVAAGTALAGSGRYASLQLGAFNFITGYATTLSATVAGNAFQVVNASTSSVARAILARNSSIGATIYAQNLGAGPAANFVVRTIEPRSAPFTVNSATKVTSLNADRLDNLDSSQLQRPLTSACADGTAVQSVSQAGAVTCENKLANAAHADAADAATTATTATNATNATNAANADNADTLDGQDSSAFLYARTILVWGDAGSADPDLFYSAQSYAYCPAGTIATGGGFATDGGGPSYYDQGIDVDADGSLDGWFGTRTPDGDSFASIQVYVVCAYTSAAATSTSVRTTTQAVIGKRVIPAKAPSPKSAP